MPEHFYLLALMLGFGYLSLVVGLIMRRQKIMPILAAITIIGGAVYIIIFLLLLLQSYLAASGVR